MVLLRTAIADPLPEVDDHLVEPGTPYEMWDGELVRVSPSSKPHARQQAKLAALIEIHVAPGFTVACELLTRTSLIDNIAPDVSVLPAAPHPVTGRRQLQQIAFEVVSTQRLNNAGEKAAKFARRGVRRVFAIDLRRTQVLEWSTARDRWVKLPATGEITDPALAIPLPIAPLVTAARADDVIARALIALGNPVLARYRAEGMAKSHAEGIARGHADGIARGRAEGIARGRAEGIARGRAEGIARGRTEGIARGIAEGKATALLVVLTTRGIAVDAVSRRRILGERDPAELDRWLARAACCRTIADVLTDT